MVLVECAGGMCFRNTKSTWSLKSYTERVFAFLGPVSTDVSKWVTFPKDPPKPERVKAPADVGKKLTGPGMDLVKQLLVWEPSGRLLAPAVLRHQFVSQNVLLLGGEPEAQRVLGGRSLAVVAPTSGLEHGPRRVPRSFWTRYRPRHPRLSPPTPEGTAAGDSPGQGLAIEHARKLARATSQLERPRRPDGRGGA